MTKRRRSDDEPEWVKDRPHETPVWQEPEWMKRPPPCTPEENYRALQLVKAVLAREISTEQAHAALHAMFGGREREL